MRGAESQCIEAPPFGGPSDCAILDDSPIWMESEHRNSLSSWPRTRRLALHKATVAASLMRRQDARPHQAIRPSGIGGVQAAPSSPNAPFGIDLSHGTGIFFAEYRATPNSRDFASAPG